MNISVDINTDILKAIPSEGNNPGGGSSGGNESGGPGSDPSGGPNPGGGPDWHPFQYQDTVREDGWRYDAHHNTSTVSVLQTYDPAGDVPVQNDKELGVLLDYRFTHQIRGLGYSHWNIAKTFSSDNMVDHTAKQRLLAHIYDHRSRLPTAYGQLDLRNGSPKWGSVKITSVLINSLNHSNN